MLGMLNFNNLQKVCMKIYIFLDSNGNMKDKFTLEDQKFGIMKFLILEIERLQI